MNIDDCIATDIPPNPSEKAERESAKSGEIGYIELKPFTAFVTSKNEEIRYDIGANLTRFFIIPPITEKTVIKEIRLTQLSPALLTELTKL